MKDKKKKNQQKMKKKDQGMGYCSETDESDLETISLQEFGSEKKRWKMPRDFVCAFCCLRQTTKLTSVKLLCVQIEKSAYAASIALSSAPNVAPNGAPGEVLLRRVHCMKLREVP